MTGEETLRALAEHRRRMVLGASPEHHEALILDARPFLTGAMMALVGAKVLDHPSPQQLLEELLAPIEQPLVDSGVIDRTSVSLKAREIASLFLPPDERPER